MTAVTMRFTIVRAALCTLAALALLAPRPALAVELDAISKAAAGYTVSDPKLAEMYRKALLNTNSQVTIASDGTTYVKTGDIPAEWLRDASVQVRPYLFFAKGDEQVDMLLRGTIARMGKYLQVDPYANAFTLNYRIWEEKFNSTRSHTRSRWHGRIGSKPATRRSSPAISRSVSTRRSTRWSGSKTIRATRNTCTPKMPLAGKGNPVAYTGMIWSGFRPSDDACTYNYLIPSEMMAVVALGQARRDRADRVPQRHQGGARQGAARRSADRDSDLRRRLHAELRLHLRLRGRRLRQRRC